MWRRNLVVATARQKKVVTCVAAQYSIDATLKNFEENDIEYFGDATDGSNHNELKLFHVPIQHFDRRKGGLQSKLSEFTNRENETADLIATYVKDTLEKMMLSKKMCTNYKRQLQCYVWRTSA